MPPINDLSYKVCLVYDYGNFFEVAMRLSKDFGKVYYFNPSIINGFPEHSPVDIGRNVPNVEKILEWASIIENVDIVVFCDAHEAALQDDFKKRGKIVLGSGVSNELEHDKIKLKELLEQIGLPVGEYYVADGIDELEEILKTIEDAYVKSRLRGSSETWSHKKYALSKGEILRMRHSMQLFAPQEKYLVDKKIKSIGEIGYDGFCINGMYPELTGSGIEIKDVGYANRMVHYKSLPKQLRNVNDKLAPIFMQNEYRGAFSTEVIIGEDMKGYLIDLTCRFGEPPTSLCVEMYKNFSQIVWDVARGIVPTIEYQFEYGVELIIYSDIAEKYPSPLLVPEQYQNYVKIKNLVIDDDGTWYYTPQNIAMKQIGACIGMGATMKEAVAMATEVAYSIEGFDCCVNTDCIGKINEQTKRLEKAGIKFL